MYIYIMSKVCWIIGLFILLVVINYLPNFQETFVEKVSISNNNINTFGNMRYPGKAFLSVSEPTGYTYNNQSDDTIPFVSFPFIK